ncbi:MAG: hypothetical protein WC071_02285 [Victivallaceae bacterium]
MVKKLMMLALVVAGVSCVAGNVSRIDIDGRKGGIVLTPDTESKNTKVTDGAWMKDDAKFFLMATSAQALTKDWQKFEFSFTPDKDGVVGILFKGPWVKRKEDKTNQPVWVAYDNIVITGTEAKNSDFEFVNQKNLFDGWSGNLANMVTGSENAQSGKNYIITWHNSPVVQTLKVKKDQKVTVTFYAKEATGKESGPVDPADQNI